MGPQRLLQVFAPPSCAAHRSSASKSSKMQARSARARRLRRSFVSSAARPRSRVRCDRSRARPNSSSTSTSFSSANQRFLSAFPPRSALTPSTAAENFGELDVRSLLRAFGIPNAADVADGWGGGRLGLYTSPFGQAITVLALRWDTVEDAAEWRDAAARYVAAAFPGATPRDCPPLDRCWSTASTLVGAGVLGTTGVLASGPGADAVAAAVQAAN